MGDGFRGSIAFPYPNGRAPPGDAFLNRHIFTAFALTTDVRRPHICVTASFDIVSACGCKTSCAFAY